MTMHNDPHVVERDRVITTDGGSPALLIIGILLAIGLAIGAYFAFSNGGADGTDITNNNTTEQVPGDTSGDTTTDTGTTDGSGTTGDTTTP